MERGWRLLQSNHSNKYGVFERLCYLVPEVGGWAGVEGVTTEGPGAHEFKRLHTMYLFYFVSVMNPVSTRGLKGPVKVKFIRRTPV